MRNIKITTILALLLFAVSQSAFAQSTIFGSVVDSKDGSGIPGAYIIIKGTNITGVTNSSGNFAMMNVPNDATLQVSYIGYKTVELPVANQTRFNITLEPDVQVLEEVVVVAPARVAPPQTVNIMGIERSINSLAAPVRQVSGNELIRVGGSIARALSFAIPGLYVIRIGGQGAGSAEVLFSMRGPVSYVVDGVPYSIVRSRGPLGMNMEFDDSFLNMFNPHDIESATYVGGPYNIIYITLKK